MYCSIYKSPVKTGSYLYIKETGDFIDVPESLLDVFGSPQFVMRINLDNRDKLAVANIINVRESLDTKGFYLQLLPQFDASLDHIRIKNTQL